MNFLNFLFIKTKNTPANIGFMPGLDRHRGKYLIRLFPHPAAALPAFPKFVTFLRWPRHKAVVVSGNF